MRVALIGYGMMGKIIEQKLLAKGHEIADIVSMDRLQSINDIRDPFDVIIDFSHPDNLESLLAYVEIHHTPIVISTTGFTSEQVAAIKHAALRSPVVYTANFSLGITVMQEVLRLITPILEDSFDMEVIEKHHNKKLDAPSGTAKMLVETLNPDGIYAEVYGREGNGKRQKEIGIHAVRGGSIVGEHSVIYAGEDEVLEIKHEAHSKHVFANGAIKAAEFLVGKPAGLYDMHDVLFRK
ncbi:MULTISPECIES: 4-hydroxy-tetrahydrodipicolinate reductase [unclassified Breznakia]|uniref:4-hydroxy-tetrahydrodipicolinate reductase n=1 Tax=unclassified Breznakia TaxID=2623764 RepID=UPI002474377D|nr:MULTISPECIES: 4-hydroxy-tetrahydrodipicolinate reductase [unclassified Breznakia]MDH6368081.1 4-hydroxy-tetrahydrodipicolinate reductase [Breznakia sp. PH1-1]MDH6405158.1 4-hydroxy-tetrahydrodipicolinate reductase [Breznakia sp. PF1-11]MDH6412884.1 4-hydroxy-tetrahydrodipicolinate reductase [Breznakia sp. PFB1-11]MDH6415234.1 4-hydroxy-tetrahydrodipicolinate reductase [Breznakia sp. PFB1-14]MDH6417544.1 4-hydroxy-tetrahydrodipicolinate reductase [Breznakia sp. PFB1-4]